MYRAVGAGGDCQSRKGGGLLHMLIPGCGKKGKDIFFHGLERYKGGCLELGSMIFLDMVEVT